MLNLNRFPVLTSGKKRYVSLQLIFHRYLEPLSPRQLPVVLLKLRIRLSLQKVRLQFVQQLVRQIWESRVRWIWVHRLLLAVELAKRDRLLNYREIKFI
jgi:hypothetical protein